MIYVGVDPALNSPGVGVVRDDETTSHKPVLIGAANIRIAEQAAELEMGERIRFVTHEIVSWVTAFADRLDRPVRPFTVVYECPQIYGVAASLGDPNDLVPLAEVAAAVAYRLDPTRIVRVKPVQWTAGTSKHVKVGNRKKLPKSIWQATRGKRMQTILSPAELALIPDQHDALDGVCLAFHPTPRGLATPRRVYPGASPRREQR